MKQFSLICALLIGCAGASVFREPNAGEQPAEVKAPAEPLFTRTDQSFVSAPRAAPSTVLLEEKELVAAPPFKAVGILEMEGKETTQLSAFYEASAKAGASFGCDVLYQRDAFELGERIARVRLPTLEVGGRQGAYNLGHFIASSGRDWTRSNLVRWQFLCGVNGATYAEQEKSMKAATSKAVEARRTALGNFEPCEPYTPVGSHVRKRDVCADAVKRSDRPNPNTGAMSHQAQ